MNRIFQIVPALFTLLFVFGALGAEESADPAKVREAVGRYLAQKGGPVQMSTIPTDGPASWCSKQYDAAAKYKDPKIMYRVVHAHLLRADQLLKGKDKKQQQIGLAMCLAASFCSTERLKDKWLAPRIAEGYLLGHLDAADDDANKYLSKENIITMAIAAYAKSEEKQKYICGYRQLFDLAVRRGDENTADACRLKLASAVMEEDPDESLKLLQAINPQGSLIGGAKLLLPKVEKALANKGRKDNK